MEKIDTVEKKLRKLQKRKKLFNKIMAELGDSRLADFGSGEIKAAFIARHVEIVIAKHLKAECPTWGQTKHLSNGQTKV